jgi:hypothetical protein
MTIKAVGRATKRFADLDGIARAWAEDYGVEGFAIRFKAADGYSGESEKPMTTERGLPALMFRPIGRFTRTGGEHDGDQELMEVVGLTEEAGLDGWKVINRMANADAEYAGPLDGLAEVLDLSEPEKIELASAYALERRDSA